MAFENIKPIEKAEKYIDAAIKKAKRKSYSEIRQKGNRDVLFKLQKIEAVSDYICGRMMLIVKNFPNLSEVGGFYLELIKAKLDYGKLKKSLAAVLWCSRNVNKIKKEYLRKIKGSRNKKDAEAHYKAFLGRCFSFVKQIKTSLEYLEKARREMKSFPVIKKTFTVAIAGFPNVGKTTLLHKISGSRPEINEYAFTTKSLMSGTLKKGDSRIQILDTPGTLNRKDKMNNIELQAYIGMKYAHLIVYVYDLTEPYPLEDQKKVFKNIKKINPNVICYMSKKDIIYKKDFLDFKKKYKCIDDVGELREILWKQYREV